MQKKLLIDASHQEETRIVLLDRDQVEEFDFESGQKKQLAGNIFLAKVTRVEPSLQAAFLDYGGNRHGFLAFSEIHPDYYQIPIADREALLAEERDLQREQEDFLERDHVEELSLEKSGSYAELKDTGDDVLTSDLLDDSKDAESEEPITKEDTIANEELSKNQASKKRNEKRSENETQKALDVNSESNEKSLNNSKQKKNLRKNKYKIQEVIKVRQVLLIQVVKDERGNKGAALTTYMSLAGRYCVLMPNTARGGGISRKITNVGDRKKLKETASQFSVPDKMGLIIRTAGAKRTKSEIKRDFEYLLRQWEQIRDLTLKSIAPCPIYEEGSVIKRSIRDLYNKDIGEIIVEGATGFKEAKEYMKMLMPSHAKKIKHYDKIQPIFSFYAVENYLSAMFNPTVQLKSGGYIVIGITEALVAIDVNSGRATKESGIEATALRTNLEAADEIARQLRMRDLAGLIVIDFIDMEERKNNASVERKTRDSLKLDRARIQIGKISTFGLLEMSRQRLRYGMVEATTQPCPNCHGTGLTRSNQNLALTILRALENKKTPNGIKETIVRAPVEVANYLLNKKRSQLGIIENRLKMRISIHADISIHNPNFVLEVNKSQTIPEENPSGTVITIDGAKTGNDEGDKTIAGKNPRQIGFNNTEEGNATKKPKRRRRRNQKNKNIDPTLKPNESPPLKQSGNEVKQEASTQMRPEKNHFTSAEPQPDKPRKSPRENKKQSKLHSSSENAPKYPVSQPSIKTPIRKEVLKSDTAEPISATDEKISENNSEISKSSTQNKAKPIVKKRVVKPVKEVLKESGSKPKKKNVVKNTDAAVTTDSSRTGWWSRNKQKEDQ